MCLENITNNIFLYLTSICAQDYTERQRETGGSSDSKYKVDALPPRRHFEAGDDDNYLVLHPARFGPRPFCDEDELYKYVPMKLEHVYKNINTGLFGADAQISERAIGLLHDRTVPIPLKVFSQMNATVSWKPMIEERRRSENRVASIVDYDWVELENVPAVQDALINYTGVQQYLYPFDFTGLALLKLMNVYSYLPYGSGKFRASLICDHFGRVSQLNVARAARGRPPLNYEGLESVLKKVLQDASLPREPPSKGPQADRRSLDILTDELQKNKGRGKNQGPQRGGGRGQGPRPGGGRTPNGKLLCYAYNDGNCTKQRTQTGCIGSNNREFVHCCSAWNNATNTLCMQAHPRAEHR